MTMTNNQRIENTFKTKTKGGGESTCFVSGATPEEYIRGKELVQRNAWNSEAKDLASDRDRTWFESHSGRRYRLRRKVKDEFPTGISWVLAYVTVDGILGRFPIQPYMNDICYTVDKQCPQLPASKYESILEAFMGKERYAQHKKICEAFNQPESDGSAE
jgi:hypothetical protein